MVQQKTVAKINPKVLEWAIDSSGWEISDLAEKLDVDPNTIENWKLKKQAIELQILEKLADCVKRPLAIFFLPKPPSEHTITDFRKISGSTSSKLSKETILAIRESRYLQSVARELLIQQKNSLKPKIKSNITIRDNPEEIAMKERNHLGFDSKEGLLSQEASGSINNRYNKLRQILESLNVFVFQSNLPVEEVRGLTLSGALPQTIVISSADSYQARIFSLMHEYGHVLLNEEGICTPEYGSIKNNPSNKQQKIEYWCNHFAASILVPRDQFLYAFHRLDERKDEPKSIINNLSRQFRVSKQVIIVRILRFFPKHPDKQKYLKEFEMLRESRSTKKDSAGFVSPVDICLSRKGKKYVSLVLDSRKKDIINNRNTIDYLNLKLKHLSAVQARL